ncbi:glycosyltransferase family A protein [Aquabacterium sp.]|uniref:glycosyltransferase family 2 protein n=1 Tax=Aquabacterium sp. TaxID=1872578 RepID=UPI0024884DF8|nr:glycosyltransferase family A protein [Aquabacterium sp.]MDI1259432.1 glycosyltransferase family A protein [Aquabacterium sp.]
MTISFVIAAYNLERYIDACVDSVLQSLAIGDEVIIVNDGSTDGTRLKLTQVQQRSTLVKVIDKQNGGVASTRNTGLAAASKDYVLFLDGDDVVRPESIRLARQHLERQAPDILVMDYLDWADDGRGALTPSRKRSHGPLEMSSSPARNLYETLDDCIPCLWSRFIKRSVFQALPHPPFPEWGMHEDLATTPHIVASARTLLYVPSHLLQYRLRAGGQTKERSERSCTDTIQAAAHASQSIQRLPPDPQLALMADVFMARKLLEAIRQCREVRNPTYALYAAITHRSLAAMTSKPDAVLDWLSASPRPEDRAARAHLVNAFRWPRGYALLQGTLGILKAKRLALRRRRSSPEYVRHD